MLLILFNYLIIYKIVKNISLLITIYDSHRFKFSLLFSVCIHAAILFAMSGIQTNTPTKRHEFFDVEFIEPLSKKVPSEKAEKPSMPLPTKSLTKEKTKHSTIKAPAQVQDLFSEHEATVLLDTTDKKFLKYAPYLQHLRARINAVWEYPDEAKKYGVSGIVTVRFTIAASGKLTRADLVHTSGHDILDREAIRTIHHAAPFDPLPSNLNLQCLNVLASFDYEISPQ